MNLVSFKCPECNANIEAKPNEQGFMFCNYCGRKILLDEPEIRKNEFEIEKSKMEIEKSKINLKYTYFLGVLTIIVWVIVFLLIK